MSSGSPSTTIQATSIPTVKATKGDDIWSKVKTRASESALIAASSISSTTSSMINNHTNTDQSQYQGRRQSQEHSQSTNRSHHLSNDQSSFDAARSTADATASKQDSLRPGIFKTANLYPLKEFGPNGEVVLGHENVVEIWNFSPSKTPSRKTGLNDSEETLNLVASTTPLKGSIELVKLLECDHQLATYTILVGSKFKANDDSLFFDVIKLDGGSPEKKYKVILPPSSVGSSPYDCQVLRDYFILTTSEGYISIFNKNNEDFSPVLNDLGISCKMAHGSPCYDVQNDWLIYYPTSSDPVHKKILSGAFPVTPLNLPKPGPLLNRVLKNLSSTAIDGIFKIAEISHSKLKKMMVNMNENGDQEQMQQLLDQLSPSNSPSSTLRDTITKILNVLNETSNKQFLVLVSLKTATPLFAFSPPGGCSRVSFSPYDLLLTTVTLRGDDIFIWDFTKFNKEISLIEKFKRGKTPGVVSKVIWYPQNKFIGVLSRNSGSLHWFQNNFINEYDESDNWTMSSFGLKNMFLRDRKKILGFDCKNNLKVIDTSGFCNTLYGLPNKRVPSNLLPTNLVEKGITDANGTPQADQGKPYCSNTVSLSSLELNYTLPYEFFYKNRKVEFHDKKDENLADWMDLDENNMTKIDFGRASGVAVFRDTEESINMLLNESAG